MARAIELGKRAIYFYKSPQPNIHNVLLNPHVFKTDPSIDRT